MDAPASWPSSIHDRPNTPFLRERRFLLCRPHSGGLSGRGCGRQLSCYRVLDAWTATWTLTRYGPGKADGLLHPVVLDAQGMLIDGRNRLEACRRAGVDPDFTALNGHE